RLDGVIDALDEGLKGAVADAVREAVGAAVSEAVQAVLLELMTNPELRKAVQQAAPDPAPLAQTPSAPAEAGGGGRQGEVGKGEGQQKPPGSLLSRAWGKVRSAAASCARTVGTALTAARLAWLVASSKAKTLVLAAGAAAGCALWAARSKIAVAAASACGLARSLA